MKWRRTGSRIQALVRLAGVEVFLLGYLLFVADVRNPLLVSAILFLLAGPVILSLLEQFVEQHSSSSGGEESLLEDATNDKGKITKSGVKERLKAIGGEQEGGEERDALTRCLALIEAEFKAGKLVKEEQAALDAKVLARYAKLIEVEIKTLVVEDKWLASIRDSIEGEVKRLSLKLAGRVKELEERYAQPLRELEKHVGAFSTKVEAHLKKMGLSV